MKAGKTLQEVATEVARRQETKRDFLVDTRELTVVDGMHLEVGNTTDPGSSGKGMVAPLNEVAHDQLGGYLDIPAKFYDRMRISFPMAFDFMANTLLHAEPKKRLVRTLDGEVRAFLSDRYRRLDDVDLIEQVLPVFAGIPDVQFPVCEVTDKRLYIKALFPGLTDTVPEVGDVVQGGVIISNSEVGLGMLKVEGFLYTLQCKNGMVTGDAVKRLHTGRQIGSDGESYEIFSDDTLAADDNAYWLKVRDVVRAASDETRFRLAFSRLKLSTQTPELANASAGVHEIAKRFSFSVDEENSVLNHLIRGGNLTQYGAANAVTRAAQDVESFDRSIELESIGGAIIEEPTWWAQISKVAVPA